MKTLIIALSVAMLGLFGSDAVAKSEKHADDSIWVGSFGRIDSWRPISRDQIIVWATPSRPYLVKIWRPTAHLRFVHHIGVTKTGGRVTRFDNVLVDGRRVPIKSIEALDRETARAMRWSKTPGTEE